jgi:prolipoprotein diacylglyceryltransferase
MHAEYANPYLYAALTALSLIVSVILLKFIRYPDEQHGIRVNALIPIFVLGALIGSKIPIILSYGWHREFWWTGKSYYGALLGAFAAINIYKRTLGVHGHFGDRFVIPLCVGAGIGKIGCFLYGCCSGTVTDCFLNVRDYTGAYVHPVQLYETSFEFLCAVFFYKLYTSGKWTGSHFILYILLYMVFRFCVEFIRMEPRMAFGFTVYQWMSLLFVPFFAFILYRRLTDASLS